MLGWLVEEKQIARIPVWDRTQRDDETLSTATSSGTNRPTNLLPQKIAGWRTFKNRVATSPRLAPSFIEPASQIVRVAR
jgi:hypothetical protein